MPRVSIIIPTYNNAQFLPSTLESVFQQTYQDYEIIVIDDGSTDNTREVLTPYQSKIRYLFQENQERSAARNYGLTVAQGELIAFLDSDDLWLPQKLERQVKVMDEYPEVVLVFSQAYFINPEGQPTAFCGDWIDGKPAEGIEIRSFFEDFAQGNVVYGGGSTSLVRREALNKAGNFDIHITHGEDWDLWWRLSALGPFAYIPEPLIYYRVFGWKKLLQRQSTEKALQEHLYVIEKNLGHMPEEIKNHLLPLAQCHMTVLAALGSYQLGEFERAKTFLKRIGEIDPEWVSPQRIMWLAVDRAKIIEKDTGSYDEAIHFIRAMFQNLPSDIQLPGSFLHKAIGWLYISGAFEQHVRKDTQKIRQLLWKGLPHVPGALLNRGVLSMSVEAILGQTLANTFRNLIGKRHA
ncbi:MULTISPECIES: glycosyltransferase [Anaerolinea]|uniref:glycosyltransferase n=1 Tax=Anaerolinea TaxID=233189 RepID=UPI002626BFE9|nr:glycosyltransferase [Anaerolinea thermophila]